MKLFFYPPVLASISATICISIIAYLSEISNEYILLMIPTFGASVVLITALPTSPLARPRNIFFGHLISASAGIIIGATMGVTFYTIGIAVGLAILFMMLTDRLHPPAGGNPILVMISGTVLDYNVLPLAVGVTIILLYSIIFNKIILKREYPWF
jgi:CBS-domain-containing membrane protein